MNLNLQPNNILLLIGPSHAGKSTFSEQLKTKLEKLNKKVKIISSDEIRKDLLQLDTQDETKTTKGQTVNHIVFPLLEKMLVSYISYPLNTDFVILDTTGLVTSFQDTINQIAKQHHYQVTPILFDIDLDIMLSRVYLPQMTQVVKNHHKNFTQVVLPKYKKNKNSIFIKKPLSEFNVSLNTNNVKLHCIDQTTHLTHVVVVGDVHECVKELRSLLNRFKHFCAEKTNYYLNGDWLDKGNDTEDTISFLKEFVKLPNCFLIKGNHENYLYRHLNNENYVYVLNDETIHFSSLPILLNNVELKEDFFKLYSQALDYVVIDRDEVQAIICHSVCEERYLNKVDNTSLKNMYKQSFKWDRPVLYQIDYMFNEAANNKPYHIFGHINVGKDKHVYRNKIAIDQGCVEGGYLTACLIDLSNNNLQFKYQKSFKPVSERTINDFNFAIEYLANKTE